MKWGPLDYLLIDLPPGTGDIHISLVNDIPVEGAVIVTTPQPVALADVEKGVNMFQNPSINRPIFGLVENMAWFTPEEHPDEKYYIFGPARPDPARAVHPRSRRQRRTRRPGHPA